jgi:predicted RNase H-like HicB family nuclease
MYAVELQTKIKNGTLEIPEAYRNHFKECVEIIPSPIAIKGAVTMNKRLMMYWKGEQFWLGKLLGYPEIMTQGETIEELEENLKDAYMLLVMDDVPEQHHTKEIVV